MSALSPSPTPKKSTTSHNLLEAGGWYPISGWPLRAIGELAESENHPAFLSIACRAKPLWRQALFFALAIGAIHDPKFFGNNLQCASNTEAHTLAGALVRALPGWTPTEILDACACRPLNGLRGVLSRIGFEPLSRDAYQSLLEWHSNVQDRRAALLQKMTVVSDDRVAALESLDPIFFSPAALPFITSRAAALELNETLNFIRRNCRGADEDSLRRSTSTLSGEKTIQNWTREWLYRVDRLSNPVKESDRLFPATTVADLIEIGGRFKNCIGSHLIAPAIAGKIAIVEYRSAPAVAVLHRLEPDKWLISGIHAPKNKPIDLALSLAVKSEIVNSSKEILSLFEPASADKILLSRHLPWHDPLDPDWGPL